MRKIYRIVATTALTWVCVATANADQGSGNLVVAAASSEPATINLAEISQITFDGGNITVSTLSGADNVFSLADIESISFDLESGGTDNITAELDKNLTVTVQNGILTATTPDNAPIAVAVYNAKGMLLAQNAFSGQASIDFNPMVKGVYIVKVNNKTVKFIR